MINRTSAPLPKGEINFEIPAIKKIKSANGIDIHFVQKDKLPIVQLIVMFSAGSKFDPAGKTGLSFLTSLMIDEGAGEYDALELNNEFDKLGSVLNITSDHDAFTFSLTSIKENFERSFELLSKIINEPKLEENDFQREKKKIIDRILQLKDEPSYIATAAFDYKVFENTFYSLPEIGYDDSVRSITLEDIRSFYREILLNSKINLIAVGNITEEEITKLSEKYLPANRNSVVHPQIIKPTRGKTRFYFIDKKDSAQSEIRVGHISKPREAEDFYAARIMNTILGGQFSSRINLNLRENKGYTYGANSSFNYFQNASSFEVGTAVNIQNTGDAVSEILKELNSIKVTISKDEINFAKSYLVKQFPSKFETYTQLARNIVPLIIHSLPLNYYEGHTQELQRVSDDEIFKAALNNIFTDELIILAVGDKTIIKPQFEMISNGNLCELDLTGKELS